MPGGRPRQYESVSDLDEIIEAYFVETAEKELWPTVTGLCLALNLTRQGLLNYEVREEFVDTIKKAKLMVEFAIEQQLMSGKPAAGPIFNLKNNFGWKDEHKQTVSGPDGQPVAVIERHIINP